MKRMKRWLSFVIAMTLAVAGLPAAAVPAAETRSEEIESVDGRYGDFEYEELDDGGLEITDYRGEGGEVVIPSEINGQSVTSIGSWAFSDCNGLTSIEIPTGVTSIGGAAFSDCSGLTSIEIPMGVTSIGRVAFSGCSGLTSIEIPTSVTSIGDSAFWGTPWLEEQMKQGGGVAIVNHIVIDADENISGSVVLPEGVTIIGDDAFYNCSGLTSIEIPTSVTSIGYSAFEGCSGLTSVSIPEGVTSIGDSAFWSTPWLEEQMKQGGGVAIVNHIVVEADENISGSIVLPEGVTSIGGYAFSGCSGLTSIEIPSGVTSIGWQAFSHCSRLASIEIPSGVTSIGEYAFNECSSLASIEIPSSVTSIGNNAFGHCSSLTSIEIPSGVTSIGAAVFWYCSSLTSIEIPSGVASIGGYAFCACSSLASIEIPSSVTSIGIYAFGSTPWLAAKMKQGGGVAIVNHIVMGADENISGSIVLPEGVTSIGNGAFWGCNSLTSIEIPSGVTSIGYRAFSYCSSLKDIYYGGSPEQWKEIEIDWEYDGNNVLKSATKHYNSTLPPEEPVTPDPKPGEELVTPDPKPGEEPDEPVTPGSKPGDDQQNPETQKPDIPSVQQKTQSIMASDITKTYGAKPFSLGASALGGAVLSYVSSNGKVASVSSNGMVTITGCGVARIMVTAAETKDYKAASKTITLTVKPKKASLVSVKSKKKKTALVKWKQDKKASGYIIECATDKNFKKNKVKMTVGKNNTVSATVKKLKPGKKYYVRACAYAKSGKTKIQGDWSKAKTVKVKK